MIHRFAIQELQSHMSYFPAVGIIGPRQVGKTTLAKTIAKELDKKAMYIDLENPADEAQLFDPVLFFQQNEERCVILDEVQRRPDLFPVLRSMIDRNRVPGQFILLGSASPDLIRNSSESLAGRIAYLELSPFNLIETGMDFENQQDLWLKGGFPGSYLAPSNKLSLTWRSNFIRSYVERDLPMLGLNADKSVTLRLWKMLAHSHANVINHSALSRSLGLTSVTLKKYTDFMEGALLLRSLPPYHTNIKKRLVKSPKIYVRDSGILHQLLAIQDLQSLMSHPSLGASWEGFVVDQIISVLGDEYDYTFYRTHQGSECDLVILKGGKPHLCIEIKYTSAPVPTRGMLQAFEDLGAKKNYIITPMSESYRITENIEVRSLKGFLDEVIS
ncbi:MAG: ATP-binding protein [Salibacteraceae bacterium]